MEWKFGKWIYFPNWAWYSLNIMREKDLISIIKETLNSKYIGDDCAYLKDLGIVVTQDSLVEGIHFLLDKITPFQLGYKSVMVNISDIVASGAEPKYLTVALSLPSNIDENFVKEFYQGCKCACAGNIQIVGGDITGADKVFISVCAIGATRERKISSRKNAKVGYKVVVVGNHGSSAIGLQLLLDGKNTPEKLIKAHLEPYAQMEFGQYVGKNIKQDYGMMDTSDGLMDALSTIANESGVLLDIDFDKIPHDEEIENFVNWQNFVLYGGEDYGIVAIVPNNFICPYGKIIGQAKEGLGVDLHYNNQLIHLTKKDVENKVFSHFKENLWNTVQ